MQLLTEDRVIATYDRTNPSAEELVDDYRTFQDYVDDHPDASAYELAKELDQPRGRLREWVDGSKPDAVAALEEMRDRGWFTEMPTPETRALNRLVARGIAAGYVTADNYAPSFTDYPEDRSEILGDIGILGFDHRLQERTENSSEIRVDGNAQLLGRALVAAGVPRGRDRTSLLGVSEYLNYATTEMRREFLGVWLLTRALEIDEDPWALAVELQSTRAASFVDDLAKLFEAEAGRSQVERVGRHIYVTPLAMERLTEDR